MSRFFYIVVLVFCLGLPAWAADHPDCDAIQRACGEAGFTRDVPGGKDLMSKCFEPMMQGLKIEGVAVAQDAVKKCQAEQKQKSSQGKHRRRG